LTAGGHGPPLLLALDTATEVASWALWRGEALAEQSAEPDRATAEVLLPALDRLLETAGVELDDVDGFAVSIGPGSFTGLRVGVATVKGLAFEPVRPTIAVPTLSALALHAAPAGPVAALLDARRDEVYAAGFEPGSEGRLTAADWLPEGVVALSDLAERLPAGCRVVGEGVRVAAEVLAATDAVISAPPYPATTARHVAALGARRFAAEAAASAALLTPRYVRRAEAEVKRTGERFEAP
jgi:tRNA threonylcarbamoyladenosine biosynthesis protein TsaB